MKKHLIFLILLFIIITPVSATVANVSVELPYNPGDTFIYSTSGNSTLFTNPVNNSYYTSIPAGQWLWNPMKAQNGDPTATFIYNGAAVIIIDLFAFISGRLRVRFNMIYVAIWGLAFWGIGWLQTTFMLVSVAVAFAVISYIRYSEEESSS